MGAERKLSRKRDLELSEGKTFHCDDLGDEASSIRKASTQQLTSPTQDYPDGSNDHLRRSGGLYELVEKIGRRD